jgi:hypothetical protein
LGGGRGLSDALRGQAFGLSAGQAFVVCDPLGNDGVRFRLRGFIYEVILCSCLIVVSYDGIVDHRSGVEVIDDGRMIDIRNSYGAVVAYRVE